MSKPYDVGGVLYPRPFRIRRLGHFGFNLNRLDEGLAFYGGLLGFQLTDETSLGKLMSGAAPAMEDDRLFFMTHNTDHHSFLLAHRSLGAMFGDDAGSKDITLSQITWQVGSLEEVVKAAGYFSEGAAEIRRIGRDMPGSNWHVYVRDPDGHTVELYYGMEQVGLLGLRPAPTGEPRAEEGAVHVELPVDDLELVLLPLLLGQVLDPPLRLLASILEQHLCRAVLIVLEILVDGHLSFDADQPHLEQRGEIEKGAHELPEHTSSCDG